MCVYVCVCVRVGVGVYVHVGVGIINYGISVYLVASECELSSAKSFLLLVFVTFYDRTSSMTLILH